jgi:hypothetical protein
MSQIAGYLAFEFEALDWTVYNESSALTCYEHDSSWIRELDFVAILRYTRNMRLW